MTLTSRIRLYLVLIAVLPVLVVMLLIWQQLNQQSAQTDQRTAERALARYDMEWQTDLANLNIESNRLAHDRAVNLALDRLNRKLVGRFEVSLTTFDLDFAELVDSNGTVLASVDRPGLLDQPVHDQFRQPDSGTVYLETVEFDRNGPHAARTSITPLKDGYYLYTGKFINDEIINRAGTVLDAEVNLLLEPDTTVLYAEMQPRKLYRTDGGFQAVLSGSKEAHYYFTCRFIDNTDSVTMVNLIGIAAIVGIISVILSIMVGMLITGRAKREIDNLVHATERVSQGDLNTPIMAYEEGEFSKLADSFSQMLVDLKRLQTDLATTEQIAAWQTMGRKIAHEIKNPMTPIAISAEDLRRSYKENLPDFDKILMQTTSMIKCEVDRLTHLLDEFVAFARIPQPEIKPTSVKSLLDDLNHLYAHEIESGRVAIVSNTTGDHFPFDRDNIWQVLINLINNSLESSESTKVNLTLTTDNERMTIRIEDNGPGFPESILENSFQPHISTKKHGSGLGLVICYRIIRDHNGQLEIYNRPKGGAGVTITLPA